MPFSRKALYVFAFVGLLFVSIVYVALLPSVGSSCGVTLGFAKISRFTLPSVQFNGVVKFRLPNNEFPNGIVVAPDGSVWFGEQDVPGIAHLFQNGTMIEYAWPVNYSSSTTSIWGVADWNGRIWASDALGGQIVSLDPNNLMVTAVKLNNVGAFPYTITVGPDDALWFTELYGSKLGRIDANCKLAEYTVPNSFGGTPTQIVFQNATSGYYADVGNATTSLGRILRFSIEHFTPEPLGGDFRPLLPSSLTLASNGLWVAEHASSDLACYSFQSNSWFQFPTTPVGYIEFTLPYFVVANGSLVWFNEHYANRIGVIDTQRGLLTEYSVSNPPANKTTQIDNALTLALGRGRVWFTELTAGYVGYINASFVPSFSTSSTQEKFKVRAGESISINIIVDGVSETPLKVLFADTENFTSASTRINFSANVTEIHSLNGRAVISVTVNTYDRLQPGNYTLLVSVGNGSINQGAYAYLQVTD